MKKKLLFIILFSTVCFSQETKSQIESVTVIENYNFVETTENYKFNNGKPISKEEEGKKPIYYTYNQNGLLAKVSQTYNNNEIQDTYYNYNTEGYIIEIIKTGKKVDQKDFIPWNKETIIYNIKNATSFTVDAVSVSSNNYITRVFFEMNGNILKKTIHNTVETFRIENNNFVYLEQTKPSKSKHSVEFIFDDKESPYRIISNEMYGDKYFINTLVELPLLCSFTLAFVSQNNCLENKNNKVSKYSEVAESKSRITYNQENLPVEIKTVFSEPGNGKEVTIKYKK
nr:hypothetical protein [Flavobacterium sp.]